MSGSQNLGTHRGVTNTTPPTFTHALTESKWLVIPALTLAMLLTVMAYAAASGTSFNSAMSSMWAQPWGMAVVMDVYAGLILAGAWIAWREPTIVRAGGWCLALALAGNIATCMYVLLALRASEGSAQLFFYGQNR